ncbi:MAG: sulfotransferase [Hyphomonadaceae bacterium]|nr:sulfotransferase [Hyphomonadaceae bacterium]
MQAQSPHLLLAEQAKSLAAEGQIAAAMTRLKEALRAEPYFLQGWLQLSRLLFEAEHFAEAVQVTQAAERFDPLDADFQSIQQHMQAQAYVEAEAIAKQMLAKEPGHSRAVYTLAHIVGLKNNAEGRVQMLDYGLSHAPANLFLRNLQVSAREEAGDYAGAIEAARTLVKTEESFPALWVLVSILLRYGQNEELLAVCERAKAHAESDPAKLSEIELVRGQILRVMGRRDESVAAYRACLDLNPKNAGAWWALADMKTFDFSGADQAAIETLLKDAELSQADKCIATFAMAKALESSGELDASLETYAKANLLYPSPSFDPDQFTAAIAARIAAFDAESLAQTADSVADGPRPIFILGLPRSGSTLLEQILASHSQIEGTIEQPVLPSIARKAHVMCALNHGGDVLEKVGALSPDELSQLGQAYLANGALFRSQGAAFFTDKLPFNFLHIGLIHKILPDAILIDARRNPMDCGLSLFKQHFPTGVDFSYDLGHIGTYYNQYLNLMDHWDRVLPGRVYHVQYEELVHDPETQIRALLKHVGVPFEPACLTFHSNPRAVRTASSEQVRQPINTKGIGAWRAVAPHLEALSRSLGAQTLARFEQVLNA